MKIKLAIVGSRGYPDKDRVGYYVWTLKPFVSLIISGGAPGVDTIAESTARRNGIPVRSIPADWDNLGRKAGPIRNTEIVAEADYVVAFWDGVSRGTFDTIAKARAQDKLRAVYNSHGVNIWNQTKQQLNRE